MQLRISLIWLMNAERRLICLSLALESTIGRISTVDYETSTIWWSQPLLVAYCNANCSDESDAEKLQISAKTDVYSYKTAHRRASSSAGTLCSGCRALMCNIQTSTCVKTSWTLMNSSNFPEHWQCRFRPVLLSAQKWSVLSWCFYSCVT